MSTPVEIVCRCCGQLGMHNARGLRATCYSRHTDAGTLHQYPRLNTKLPRLWRIETYQELAASTTSREQIAARLGVTERSVQRYAAALRASRTERNAT